MRAVPIVLALLLTSCGGPEKADVQAENIILAPEALQLKPTATSIAGVDLLKPFGAFGTEPYWSLSVAPDKISFEDFSVEDGVKTEWAPQPAKVTGNVAVIETKTPKGEAVTITLTGESCLEVGEDENALPLRAEVKIGDRTLKGCAGEKLPSALTPEAENAGI